MKRENFKQQQKKTNKYDKIVQKAKTNFTHLNGTAITIYEASFDCDWWALYVNLVICDAIEWERQRERASEWARKRAKVQLNKREWDGRRK